MIQLADIISLQRTFSEYCTFHSECRIKHCLHVCCPPILDGGGVHILAVVQLVIASQWAGVKTVPAIRDIVTIVRLS